MPTPAAPDRRTALKAKHRDAILSAARQLIAEREGPRFTVDELADRADVARRTVFNHFASVDEVVLALCIEALDGVIEDLLGAVAAAPVGAGTPRSVFDGLAESLRSADLPRAISAIVAILGYPGSEDQRGRTLESETFSRVGGRLVRAVNGRYPASDPLDVELLVGSLVSGISVIARHWIRSGEESAQWADLLSRLLTRVRSGYAPTT
jgi:TetR/AcrR family transcriptional regulator, regulator of autoinduction and epiphytic fitness